MRKKIRWVIMGILLAVFLFSGITALTIMYRYKVSDARYEAAVEKYVTAPEAVDTEEPAVEAEDDGPVELAPIVVDFEGLKKESEDVVGWIYAADTLIDYPVVQGEDDDFYLHHSYNGEESASGAIFVEAENSPGFADANTILYGHHMKNKSMFATLSYWGEQEYYEQHPVWWLLTPEQDYKITLFAGYTTSATSDTYTIFPEAGAELEEYIASAAAQSEFQASVEPGGKKRYVLLSTCSYNFNNARYVLHGILEPVDSAGGIRKK